MNYWKKEKLPQPSISNSCGPNKIKFTPRFAELNHLQIKAVGKNLEIKSRSSGEILNLFKVGVDGMASLSTFSFFGSIRHPKQIYWITWYTPTPRPKIAQKRRKLSEITGLFNRPTHPINICFFPFSFNFEPLPSLLSYFIVWQKKQQYLLGSQM